MRKILICILSIALLLALCACGSQDVAQSQEPDPTQSEAQQDNPLIGKIYTKQNLNDSVFDFTFLIFYDDGTMQGVKSKDMGRDEQTGERVYSYTNTFGTYEIDGSKVTMSIMSEDYAGVLDGDGESVAFGAVTFSEEQSGFSDAFYENLKK